MPSTRSFPASPLRASLLLLTALISACPEPEPAGTWQWPASDLREALMAVHGRSADDVWAVGADKGQGPLVLHFDGTAWTQHSTGTEGDLWWVHAVPGGSVWMAGARGTIVSTADGATFLRHETPSLAAHTLFGLWARSDTDVWAVGSLASRNGFVWHFDGQRWREVAIPASELPALDHGDVPGFFKVWGDAQGSVWISGGHGVLLRSRDGQTFRRVTLETNDPLFTVTGHGDELLVVGGGNRGTVVTVRGEAVELAHPEGLGLLQGVAFDAGGRAYVTGSGARAWYRGGDRTWRALPAAGARPELESLHAAWVDDEGGLWSVGGGVLSGRLGAGGFAYFGTRSLPTWSQPALPTPPEPVCPVADLERAADKSIARRWNEQVLAAIRKDIPRPGVHARNLFHLSAAMYDAWAAYDATADGQLVTEKHSAADPEAAREVAISHAAYRVLSHRYAPALSVGGAVSTRCFDGLMARLGLDPHDVETTGTAPSAVGNRIGLAYIEAFRGDGANEAGGYQDEAELTLVNPPMAVDQPGTEMTAPDRWQRLILARAVTQNGIPTAAGAQEYIGSHWGRVVPFALSRASEAEPFFDVGEVPAMGPSLQAWALEVVRHSSLLDPAGAGTIDISPGAFGNNSLGANDGTGHPVNPSTGAPYAENPVPLGDFSRVMAEYWADGPRSETPPGHWNVLANKVADAPGFQRRLGGEGPELDPLAWDVQVYFALNAGLHDAAIACWDLKRRHLTARPISLIRWFGGRGQSSDPSGPSYDSQGLPLEEGLVEVITPASSAPGERHAHLARSVGQVAVRSWRGEPGDRARTLGGVGWVRAVEWMPYQLRTFVTPGFPGFVSGHSTFSRSGAVILARLTGSPYFPGGLAEHVVARDTSLTFERGPSTEVRLQWATYYDAADQAGQSRLWGGIHIAPDDFVGRQIGAQIGDLAVEKSLGLFDGSARP